MGLRLGSTAEQIEKNYKDSDAQLTGLINRWVATDINKSWEKLVEAMEMSDHGIQADKLACDKNIGVRQAKQQYMFVAFLYLCAVVHNFFLS